MSNQTADLASSPEVDTPATHFRTLEWFLFAATIVGGIGVAGSAMGGLVWTIVPMLSTGLVAFASLIVVPGLVHADASRIRSLELDWTPRPMRWAIATFFLTLGGGLAVELLRMPVHSALQPVSLLYYNLTPSPPMVNSTLLTASAPLGALYYLGRRYQHLEGVSPSRFWWLVLPAVVIGAIAYLVAELFVQGSLNEISAVTMVLATLFPIGAYMDALYLRHSTNQWNPNPAVQFLLAYLSVIVFPLSILYPSYAVYHLGRRWRGRTASVTTSGES